MNKRVEATSVICYNSLKCMAIHNCKTDMIPIEIKYTK